MPLPGIAGIAGFVGTSAADSTSVATLTIASGTVGSNLTDFPVLVDLSDMPAGFWSGVDADGGNIRVKQSGSVIPFDLCMIDTGAETGILVFLAPTLNSASDNVFTIDLDGDGLLDATDPNGRNTVWADYEVVAGFDGTTTDRTGTSRTVTGGHETALVNPGFFRFADSGDWRDWDGVPTLLTEYTISAAYYLTSAVTTSRAVAAYQTSSFSTSDAMSIHEGGSDDGIALWNPSDGWLQPQAVGATAATLYRAAFTSKVGGDRALYFNGTLLGTDPRSLAAINADMLRIGTATGATLTFSPGEVGYVYMRLEILSDDWLAAEYESWHSPATFYAVS